MISRIRAAFASSSPTIQKCWKVVAWLPLPVVYWQHVGSVLVIEGRSMQPTFNPNSSMMHEDVVLLNRAARLIKGGYRIGDVVAFWPPGSNTSDWVVKRIIALEGDIVRTLPPYKDKTVQVPPGQCWVEGDEPLRSLDSNTYGPLPIGLISGRVEAILWPHWRSRWMHRTVPEPAAKRVIYHRRNVR